MRTTWTAAALALSTLLLAGPAHAGWQPAKKQIDAYNAAADAHNAGEFEEALRRVDQVLSKDPSCGMCRSLRTEALLRLNRDGEALAEARILTRRFPDAPGAFQQLSMAAFASEDFDLAMKAAEKGVERAPSDPDAWRQRLNVARRIGDDTRIDESLAAIEQHMDPGEAACIRASIHLDRDQIEDAEAATAQCTDKGLRTNLTSSIARTRGERGVAVGTDLGEGAEWIDLVNASIDALATGRLEEALRHAEAAHEQQPDSPMARMLVGRTHRALGHDEDALAAFESVFGDTPKVDITREGYFVGVVTKRAEERYLGEVSSSVVQYASLLVERGEEERLERGLDALQEKWPELGAVAGAHAQLAALRGDLPGAWQRIDRALATYAQDDSLAAFVAALVVLDPARLSPKGRERLSRPGGTVSTYNAAAQLYMADDDASCLMLLDLMAPDPELETAKRNLRVSCAQGTGDADAAANAVADAGGIQALRPAARYNHARTQMQQGNAAGARDTLAGFAPEDAEVAARVNALRVDALMELGEFDAAAEHADDPGVEPSQRFNLALRLQRAGRSEPALALLQGVPATGELATKRPLLEGEILLALARFDDAMALARAHPDHPDVPRNVALTLIQEERYADARSIEPAGSTDPIWAAIRVQDCLQRGDLDGAFRETDRDGADPRAQFDVGMELLREDDLPRARTLLGRACATIDVAQAQAWCSVNLPKLDEGD